jgi:DNA-binding response OmpR family regulator
VEQTKGSRILIVDDEPNICEMLSRYLTADGYVCTTAASADIALEVLAAGQFHLAICDIMMPGMSGIDFLNIVTHLYPSLAVIMVTAVDDRDTGLMALELGAYGYVIKPFTRNEILIQVAGALHRNWEKLRHQDGEMKLSQQRQSKNDDERKVFKLSAGDARKYLKSRKDALEFMEKFNISAEALLALMNQMVATGEVKRAEVDQHMFLSPETVVVDVNEGASPPTERTKAVIKAKDALVCIRDGMDDAGLMKRYNLSAKGLRSLFQKLVKARFITEEELRQRLFKSGTVIIEHE